MATISGREEAFKKAKASIEPQVDRFVSVKDHEKGDAGKFCAVDGDYDYFFSCDDDLLYPDDYVKVMVAAIERYKRKAVISLHGKVLKPVPIKSYYRKGHAKAYNCLSALKEDAPVNVAGTGVMAFHRDTIEVSYFDFHTENMADIWMGVLCQQKNVPQVVLAHKSGWMKSLPVDNRNSIYQQGLKNDSWQTSVINSLSDWKLLSA